VAGIARLPAANVTFPVLPSLTRSDPLDPFFTGARGGRAEGERSIVRGQRSGDEKQSNRRTRMILQEFAEVGRDRT